jgi:Rrf2 family protein
MKISTKGRYGLRAMVDLALNSMGDHVSLNSIAERQNISENYLEQVFSVLRKSCLVKSVKGAQGGYSLADSAANISAGKILRALEGNLSVIDEDAEMTASGQGSVQHCINACIWGKVNENINSTVDAITLEDLVTEYRKMNGILSEMYYI